MSLQLTLIDSHEKLTSLRPEWDALAGENPFLRWDWAETWWRHYQTAQVKLFTLAVRNEDSQLVGLAPWKLRHTLTRGRVVRFIGSNEVCGDRLSILARPEERVKVLQSIAGWLATDARDDWDLLELTGVEQSNQSISELTTLLADQGHQTHIREDLNCWKIFLPDSWETYLQGVSKSRRNKTRRFLKRTIDAGNGCQRLANSMDELDQGFEILVDLHQKRRNALGEPGCFASERYHAFHREFAQRMLNQGRLRLCWLELAGRPAAVEYSILGDKNIFNYQSGFEPALADEHPGWINLTATLRWAIGKGYEAFDMLRGDESYKASFGAQSTPLMQVRVIGHRNSARLRHAAWRTQATVKRWARERFSSNIELRQAPLAETAEVGNDE